jgi:hypothetical protein
MYKPKWQNGYAETHRSATEYLNVPKGPMKIVESAATRGFTTVKLKR